jgi:hypothetical protein
MQKNPFISFLAGALCLAAVAVFALTIICEWRFRQLRRIQPLVLQVQQNSKFADALANEIMEYSKRNPAVDPILQNVGLKPAKTTTR